MRLNGWEWPQGPQPRPIDRGPFEILWYSKKVKRWGPALPGGMGHSALHTNSETSLVPWVSPTGLVFEISAKKCFSLNVGHLFWQKDGFPTGLIKPPKNNIYIYNVYTWVLFHKDIYICWCSQTIISRKVSSTFHWTFHSPKSLQLSSYTCCSMQDDVLRSLVEACGFNVEVPKGMGQNHHHISPFHWYMSWSIIILQIGKLPKEEYI